MNSWLLCFQGVPVGPSCIVLVQLFFETEYVVGYALAERGKSPP